MAHAEDTSIYALSQLLSCPSPVLQVNVHFILNLFILIYKSCSEGAKQATGDGQGRPWTKLLTTAHPMIVINTTKAERVVLDLFLNIHLVVCALIGFNYNDVLLNLEYVGLASGS